ncbi:MAG: hypothetical protein RI996_559 [Candidatus Parcubacteria bacterium]|jgi:8-oxo-dGTP pyrophosphatase MutT (NUDIX family)
MKQFTVVFPVARVADKDYILLGQQALGKPLADYINGYGGKVEESDSSIEDAAKRELEEELGMQIEDLTAIGSIVHENKQVFFFLSSVEYIEYDDTLETRNNSWYELNSQEFIGRMLPGDIEIIEHIREHIEHFWNREEIQPFRIQKEGSAISEAVQKLDESLLPRMR